MTIFNSVYRHATAIQEPPTQLEALSTPALKLETDKSRMSVPDAAITRRNSARSNNDPELLSSPEPKLRTPGRAKARKVSAELETDTARILRKYGVEAKYQKPLQVAKFADFQFAEALKEHPDAAEAFAGLLNHFEENGEFSKTQRQELTALTKAGAIRPLTRRNVKAKLSSEINRVLDELRFARRSRRLSDEELTNERLLVSANAFALKGITGPKQQLEGYKAMLKLVEQGIINVPVQYLNKPPEQAPKVKRQNSRFRKRQAHKPRSIVRPITHRAKRGERKTLDKKAEFNDGTVRTQRHTKVVPGRRARIREDLRTTTRGQQSWTSVVERKEPEVSERLLSQHLSAEPTALTHSLDIPTDLF